MIMGVRVKVNPIPIIPTLLLPLNTGTIRDHYMLECLVFNQVHIIIASIVSKTKYSLR